MLETAVLLRFRVKWYPITVHVHAKGCWVPAFPLRNSCSRPTATREGRAARLLLLLLTSVLHAVLATAFWTVECSLVVFCYLAIAALTTVFLRRTASTLLENRSTRSAISSLVGYAVYNIATLRWGRVAVLSITKVETWITILRIFVVVAVIIITLTVVLIFILSSSPRIVLDVETLGLSALTK
jgi:hypothetical protein